VRTAILVPALVALAAFAATAEPIIIEAEDYVASFNVGGDPIYVTACSGASGGFAVEGYDTIGDFIELRVVLPMVGEYDDTLRSAGELYEFSEHIATFRYEGGGTFAHSYYTTMGYGIG